jgi:polyhydroxybutyrate depolymerase
MSQLAVALGRLRPWRTAVAVLAGLLLVAGCNSLAHARGGEGTDKDYTMKSGGLERSYRLYLPSDYDPSKPLPLLVALHGGFGTGPAMERVTGFDRLADAARFIVAYPSGIRRSWNAGDKCCDPARRMGVDDVGFMQDLVAKIESDYRIDSSRVYGAGFSNGAMLLLYTACQDPSVFTAIAVNSGALMSSKCNGGRVPTMLIHGRKDPRIPWNGGSVRTGGWSDVTYRQPFLQLVQKIAERNGCSTSEKVTYDTSPAKCQTYKGCGANEVTWCGVQGMGHQWAGGETFMPLMLGENTNRFSSTNMMWSFFSRHRRGQDRDTSPPALAAPVTPSGGDAGSDGGDSGG